MSARDLSAATCACVCLVALVACSRDSKGGGGAPSASAASVPVAPAASSAVTVPEAGAVAVAAPSEPLNVVLVSIDSLRADMPWTGYERAIAPRLTELAGKAVVYTHAYSLSSYTSMAVGGLLSGKIPSELHRDGYFFGTYGEKNRFLAEVLKDGGVKTMSAHAHGYFKKGGFQQGFDTWELVPNLKWNNTTDENSTGPQLEELAEKILSDPARTSGKFFAWFHFLDPHDQYLAHEGISWGKTARDRYDAEVTYVDRYIGKLVDFVQAQPWGKRTAILITSDHGEAFGEHDRWLHGFELWEPLVRIPLLALVPGAAPRRIDTPRSAVDLAPTIAELTGTPPDPGFEGQSLVGEIFGKEPEPRDVLIDLPATSDNTARRALVHGSLKIISFGEKGAEGTRIFDLAADPEEKKPLPLSGDPAKEMLSLLRDAQKKLVAVAPVGCGEGCLGGAYNKKK